MAKHSTDKKNIKEFFSHDFNSRSDEKIVALFYYFRQHINDFPVDLLKELLGFAAYGVYWSTVEYMHINKSPLAIDKINMVADSFRIKSDFLTLILNNFDLFRIENDTYINDRILRNLEYKETKSEQNQDAANTRWLISAFNKAYEKEFGEKPILSTEEIEKLKKYNDHTDNLKDKFPDILHILKNLKFDTDINFKPCANWLLAKNNLGKILNGEFGQLNKKTTASKEQQQKQLVREAEEKALNESTTLQRNLREAICDKQTAITYLKFMNFPIITLKASRTFKDLSEKYGITFNEMEEIYAQGQVE